MIFNTESTATNWDAVKESQYEPGIYGALMHVYENECNYNLMMKAVGLSELKYYQENNGAELFVNEAGAVKGFVEKAKALFKSIIEKIKGIFKKFASVINSYVMSDKDFVKKYEKELLRKDLKDFEFKGYTFPLDMSKFNTTVKAGAAGASAETWAKGFDDESASSDKMDEAKDSYRGQIAGAGKSLDETEFRDYLKDKLYGNDGDKDTLENISIRTELEYIGTAAKLIKEAERQQKDIVKNIENMIKDLDKQANEINKTVSSKQSDDENKTANTAVKAIDREIALNKQISNDYTTLYGVIIQALKDRNRQAKAICVKALSYKVKNESAYAESGNYSDLFAGVTIL